MDNKEILELSTSAWREKVYIETSEHVICGYVFMPKIGKKTRLLTEILNTGKTFLAAVEQHEFMQVNISSILIMRPLYDE